MLSCYKRSWGICQEIFKKLYKNLKELLLIELATLVSTLFQMISGRCP